MITGRKSKEAEDDNYTICIQEGADSHRDEALQKTLSLSKLSSISNEICQNQQ